VIETTTTTTWPEAPGAGALGDGRYATARERPENIIELREVVREHVSRGYAIYPQGGVTALDYGGIPSRPGVAIDMRSLGGVIDYPYADMTITVQAGINASLLRSILAEKGQRLLIDIPQADQATLGGVYATNACGPRRFGLGRPRDQIIGVGFVTSAGVEVKGGGRVVKNVAGYDFPKLLTGSLGTLGILSQLTLKVRPMPESTAIVWSRFSRLEEMPKVLDALNTSGTRPVALEILDSSAARQIGASRGLPHDGWVLVVGLEDNAASVRWQVDRLLTELGRSELTVLQDEGASEIWSALTDFQATASGPIQCLASVPPSSMVEFLMEARRGEWCLQSHAGNGVIRLNGPGTWDLEAAEAEVQRLRTLAARRSGHVVLVRCPTDWKARLGVWGPPRPDWALSQRVKSALDPAGAMNPGRLINIR
jgi:glycolate oxidase FAD binding subunit